MGYYGWVVTSTVQYRLDSSLSSRAKDRIREAYAAVNAANKGNGSNVVFVEGGSHIQWDWAASGGGSGSAGTTEMNVNSHYVVGAITTLYTGNSTIYDPNESHYDAFVRRMAIHEILHTLGIEDANSATGDSIMEPFVGFPNGKDGQLFGSPTACDNNRIDDWYDYGWQWNCGNGIAPCAAGYSEGPDNCCIQNATPILLTLDGKNIELSSEDDGVYFDIKADGNPLKLAWPSSSRTVFLVLDRNGNGKIDNGTELFGNLSCANGYELLRELDSNGDDWIDSSDPMFESLRLWGDADRNGVSEEGELLTLSLARVAAFSLDYNESARRDKWGNLFRYRATIRFDSPASNGTSWDVYLNHVGR